MHGAIMPKNYITEARKVLVSFSNGTPRIEKKHLPDLRLSPKTNSPTKEQPGSLENFRYIARTLGVHIALDVLSKETLITFSPDVEAYLAQEGIDLAHAASRERFLKDVCARELGIERWDDFRAIIEDARAGNFFHPARPYLDGLPAWDGQTDHIGALANTIDVKGDPQVFRDVLAHWMVQAVHAVMQVENATFDAVGFVLVLIGPQGCGKSRFCRALVPPHLSGSEINLKPGPSGNIGRDQWQRATSHWVRELSEIAGTTRNRTFADPLKSFLTTETDTHRMLYDKMTVSVPRGTVYIGTSNESGMLADETGNRRFWVFEVKACDFDVVPALRDPAWAQALALWRSGMSYWLTGDLEKIMVKAAHASRVTDWIDAQLERQLGFWARAEGELLIDWKAIEAHHPDAVERMTPSEIAAVLGDMPHSKVTRSHSASVTHWMEGNGWERYRLRRGKGRYANAERVFIVPVRSQWPVARDAPDQLPAILKNHGRFDKSEEE